MEEDEIMWTASEPLEPGEVLPGVMAETFTVEDDFQPCYRHPEGWWCSRRQGHEGPCAARRVENKTYETVKFVNPRDAVVALDGMAVHAVAGPHDADAHGILVAHPERDGCMVSFHDVLTNEEIVRTDIRNFVEIIVP